MCIGLPMQVTRVEPGHAWCAGRSEQRRVNTALVGDCAPGDWLLIFLDGARERISEERAIEVNAALDLLADAMRGLPAHGDVFDPGFELPSSMSAGQVAALSGQAVSPPTPVPPQTEKTS